jgi:hypothetical protein
MRLVDSLEEQSTLEDILEGSKPRLHAGTEKVHYLLATPFRYRPRAGSRFRAPFEAGVWYGAEELRTALAEKSFWHRRFLLDSPGTPDLKPVAHTAFRASVRGPTLDLTLPPLDRDRHRWTDRGSYAATQGLAKSAREAGVEVIRYESVRDPEHARCEAVLVPTAFSRPKPRSQQSWLIAASRARVRCAPAARGGVAYEFSAEQLDGPIAA